MDEWPDESGTFWGTCQDCGEDKPLRLCQNPFEAAGVIEETDQRRALCKPCFTAWAYCV